MLWISCASRWYELLRISDRCRMIWAFLTTSELFIIHLIAYIIIYKNSEYFQFSSFSYQILRILMSRSNQRDEHWYEFVLQIERLKSLYFIYFWINNFTSRKDWLEIRNFYSQQLQRILKTFRDYYISECLIIHEKKIDDELFRSFFCRYSNLPRASHEEIIRLEKIFAESMHTAADTKLDLLLIEYFNNR